MNAITTLAAPNDLLRMNWADAQLPIDWRSPMGSRGLLLVMIHGTWCHACLEQITWLQRKHVWLTEQGIGILAVAMDNTWQVEAFTSALSAPLPFRLIADDGAALARALGLYDETKRFTRSAVLLIDCAGGTHFAQLDEHTLPEQARLLDAIVHMPL